MELFGFFKKKMNENVFKTPASTTLDTVSLMAESGQGLPPLAPDDDRPSLEALIKQAIPSKEGLYPHEILMLDYAHTYKLSSNRFQGFWLYQYSVKDPQSVLNSLYARGFIEPGGLRSVFERMKVPELKNELKAAGEKVTGKKTELIDRLLVSGDQEALNRKYPIRYFTLTEKGKAALEANEYVSYLHRHKYASIWDINRELASAQNGVSYRDVLWDHFNRESLRLYHECLFGLHRNMRMYMYEFLMEEKKYQGAFERLCEVIACDLSGLSNGDGWVYAPEENPSFYASMMELQLECSFPYEDSVLVLPPAIIEWLAGLQQLMGLSDPAFKEMLLEQFHTIQLPFRIFTNEECAGISMAEIAGDKNALKKIYKEAERREKKHLAAFKKKYHVR